MTSVDLILIFCVDVHMGLDPPVHMHPPEPDPLPPPCGRHKWMAPYRSIEVIIIILVMIIVIIIKNNNNIVSLPHSLCPETSRPLAVLFNNNTHSFIHTKHLYSASSRGLLRGAPDSSTAKKSSLKLRKNAGERRNNNNNGNMCLFMKLKYIF